MLEPGIELELLCDAGLAGWLVTSQGTVVPGTRGQSMRGQSMRGQSKGGHRLHS